MISKHRLNYNPCADLISPAAGICKYLGKPDKIQDNLVSFTKQRNIGSVTIQGVSTNQVTQVELNFNLINNNDSLITLEIPCRQEEIASINDYLMNIGGTVSAIHNHWLFDEPKLYYLHWQIRVAPIYTALKLVELWNSL